MVWRKNWLPCCGHGRACVGPHVVCSVRCDKAVSLWCPAMPTVPTLRLTLLVAAWLLEQMQRVGVEQWVVLVLASVDPLVQV